ncbi:sensor histidine kinase [Alishewanella sp. HL-SH06]|uniref:sensor histidine kinase n=1 Tax=Alishewanella sp. HL-SH06 TaxID=3461144 RepID=UPI004041D7D8
MYQRKLIVSLCILLTVVLLQSVISFWAHQNSEFHTERNRIANQMLAEFFSLRADKQRLKVWLAEYLLTENANTDFRDTLSSRMQAQLTDLDQLAIRDQLYSTSEADLQHIMAQVKVISLLQSNLQTLERALKTQEIALYSDDAERWRILIAMFDTFQDTDLAELLQQAILQQKQRAELTEQDALNALLLVKRAIAAISVIAILLTLWLAIYLSRALSRPLQNLLSGTQQLQQGHFSHRIHESGSTEFTELARQFNLMSGYIFAYAEQEKKTQQATEQLVQTRTSELQNALTQLHHAEQRQKQLLTDISHELRTPATSIQGEAEISLRGKDKDIAEYKEAFERILAASNQLNQRIDDLLFLARGEDRLVQVSLKPLLTSTFMGMALNIIKQHLNSRFELEHCLVPSLPEDQWLLLDVEKFAVVLRIITDNAQHYSRQHTCLKLAFSADQNELRLQLTDQGIGLQPADRQQLFQRHYRSAAARQARPDGLGVGLCIAKAIVEAHDGSIRLDANDIKGCTVTIGLPHFCGTEDENTDC